MSYFTKSLFRLTVVTFIFAMLMLVTTTRADPPDVKGCHFDHKECPVVDESDEPTSTFEVEVKIEGSTVVCGNENCKSKPIRVDRLDRTTSLVVREMDMIPPLQGFLARQFTAGIDRSHTTIVSIDLQFDPLGIGRAIVQPANILDQIGDIFGAQVQLDLPTL